MKLKLLGSAALTVLALSVLTGSASATTLEVRGAAKNETMAISASLKAGTSALLTDTAGSFANTCTYSSFTWVTFGPYTGLSVEGDDPLFSFSPCREEKVVMDENGTMYVSTISGTTNGTVSWKFYKVTTPSPFGSLSCESGATRDIGTLTGVASGNATLNVNATLNCGIVTGKWTGTYVITSPEGLGVGA